MPPRTLIIAAFVTFAPAQDSAQTVLSSDRDPLWMLVTEHHDTLRNCTVDSVRGSEIFLDGRIFSWVNINEIALLRRKGPNHVKRNTLIGSLVGGVAGLLLTSVAGGESHPFGSADGARTAATISTGVLGASVGAMTGAGIALLTDHDEIITLHGNGEQARKAAIRKFFVEE